MKATATSDIDQTVLEALRDDLAPDLSLLIDERRIALLSTEPPSWIQFFADSQWWIKALGAYAALYVAEIVKEAGKETWKERARLGHIVSKAGDKIVRLTQSLLQLRGSIPERSELVLGLPIPDDHFGIRFNLVGRDESILAAEISLFVCYIPAIERIIETENLKSGKVLGAITMHINDDASLRLSWTNWELRKIEERTLFLRDKV